MTALRDLVELVRAPAALSVPGDAVAGAAAAGTLGPRTAGLAAASVCLYWAGMAANDWADRDIDSVERPERPLPAGRVAPGVALGAAVGLSAAGLALAGLAGGRRALAVAAPLTAMVWGYDLRLKRTPAGPAAMATCRGLDVLLGASAAPWSAVPQALVVAAHTYTVTALSVREVTGSTPALPRATLVATGTVAAAAARGPLSTGLALWYAASYGHAQLHAAAEPNARNLRAAVGAGITGLPALQGALAAQSGATVAGIAVAAAAPVGRLLARRVSPT